MPLSRAVRFSWPFLDELLEPISSARARVMHGTWDIYGFESVIWASRPNHS